MPDAPPYQSRTALLAHSLLLGGGAAAVFVAGGAPQGNLGVFLLCAGVALLACPPRVRVEGRLWAAAAGLVLCSGLAFLPARWVAAPLWRKVVSAVPIIHLPGTITPAPGETAFWIGVLALSALVGLFTLTQPVRSRGMMIFALAAVTVDAGYAALAMYAKATGWVYPFSGGASFGFLPNRNHSATFLITGAVVSAGLMSVAFRERRWILADLAVAGGLTCATALCFFSGSRAGVLILFVGGGLWLAGLGGRHRPGTLLLAAAVVAAAGGGLFLAVKSPARDRMLDTVGVKWGAAAKTRATPTPTPATAGGSAVAAPVTNAGGEAMETPLDFRVSVYRDAWRMVRDQPWTGTGLGTFAGVFAQYREASLVRFNALHPESDWMMLAAEAGLPACGFALALVVLAAARLRGGGTREHPFWPLRWGFGAAAGAALLHSVADVPAHRAAVGWWMLALAGLALQRPGGTVRTGERSFNAKTRRREDSRRKEEEGEGWIGVQRGVFVLGGVGALLLGGTLVRAEWMGGPALPPFAALQAPQQMYEAYQRKEYEKGEEIGRRTMQASPLTAAVYYYAGVFRAVSDEEGVDVKVDEMFQAERVLDPVMPDVAHRQAMAWAGYDPARQAAMAVEELGRMGRIHRAMGQGWTEDRRFYEVVVTEGRADGELQRSLLAVTRPDPRFVETWQRSTQPELLAGGNARIEADRAWREEGGGTLRPDWYLARASTGATWPGEARKEGGGGGAVGEKEMPEWWSAAWPVRLRQMVYAGQYREAVEAAAARYGISLGQTEGAGGEGAKEAEGEEAEAWRKEAWRAAAAGKWKEAWLALERYVRRTRQIEWP